jgi:hypothetical protein
MSGLPIGQASPLLSCKPVAVTTNDIAKREADYFRSLSVTITMSGATIRLANGRGATLVVECLGPDSFTVGGAEVNRRGLYERARAWSRR